MSDDNHTGSEARRVGGHTQRLGVGVVLIIIAIGLWAFTFAWMRLPYYLFHSEGQLYALFPLALATEAVVVVVAIVALVIAIMDRARRRTHTLQMMTVIVGALLMLTIGPVLLWFGTIPFGANLVG
jgi:NADH:ubiquinone oxidoreductase subunit K